MRRTITRALVIVAVSSTIGLVLNVWSPKRIPYLALPKAPLATNDVATLDVAKRWWNNASAVFLDARAPADYAAGHIANAVSLPIEDFDQRYAAVARQLAPDTRIVVYCDGTDCDLSHRLAARLRALGYRNVRLLVNGWTTWHTAGLATRSGREP